jgi:hypothetical protein
MRQLRDNLFPLLLLGPAFLFLSFTAPAPLDRQAPPVVEAGTSQTIQLPVSEVWLRGFARSANGKIVSFQWSFVSGPGRPELESPGQASTRVASLEPGLYTFRLTAVDAAGLTGTDTTQLRVLQAPERTLTAQPAANPAEALIVMWYGDPGAGTDPQPPEICAAAWTKEGSPLLLRTVIRFDLSDIPANATILSARLSLFSNPRPLNGNHKDANSGTMNAIYLERITEPWTNPGVNWLNQPPVSSRHRLSIPHSPDAFQDLENLDVTSLVTDMVREGNYGFIMRLQQERTYTIRNFCSSRDPDPQKHPRLVIRYRP